MSQSDAPIAAAADRGWWHPPDSRKAHYVVAGRSLCGRWGVIGRPVLIDTDSAFRDCCAKCKRLKAREAVPCQPTSP